MTRKFSRLLHQGQLRLAFCLMAVIACHAHAQDGLDSVAAAAEDSAGEIKPLTIRDNLDSLAYSEEGKSEALARLIASDDSSFAPLYRNLFQGNVYLWNTDSLGHGALVIAGPETEIDGESRYPLWQAWPYAALLLPDGSQARVPSDSLVELDVDRGMRALLQPVLTALDLGHGDMQKRRNAALSLGESGDTLFIGMLRKAAAKEKNRRTKHLMLESVSRLELFYPDADRQIRAALELAAIHGTNGLPKIKTMAKDEPPAGAGPEWKKAMGDAIKSIEGWNSLTNTVQAIFTGVSLGSILILMALGLSIIFGLMGVINMAHGEFMMLGAYATFVTQNFFVKNLSAHSDWFLVASFPVAFVVAGGMGMFVEWVVIRRLYGRPLETLLATWGLSLVLIQAARHIFGDLTAVTMPAWLGGGLEIMSQITLPYNRIFIMALTLVIVLGMSALFYGTRIGLKIRAVTQNRSMSGCLGVPTRRVDNLTFGLGTGIAGIAGCALTQIGNVDPGMGQNYIVDSFLVVVTGGVGKLVGTVLAGFGIGSLNKFLEPALQAVYAKVALLALVILFLQVRPSGIFPAKGRNEDT